MNFEGSAFSSFKKYDIILNNKQEPYEQKIKSLVDIWRNISELNEHIDIKYVVQIIDWAKLHTLYIVLTAEWKNFKAQYEKDLLGKIEKSQEELRKFNSVFPTQCQKLIKVVRTPWEDPVLERLLQTKDASIGQQELDFFCAETTYLVSVRLKKLCESQCEDLALNLVTAFMNCNKLAKEKNSTLHATDTQLWFIFDIYIALLYKFQENQKIVALLKELSLDEGLQLIHRFSKKRVKILKIWKYCHRIAILASQVFVSTAAVKFSEEHRDILEKLVETFIFICNTDEAVENFTKSLRRISQLADAAGLYVFCDVVHRRMGLKLKPFTIEMYIRALTADMNNLERQKNDNETDKVTATSKKLAQAFCKLADILGDNVNVVRECVLTAFSLEPTKERLQRIEDLARKSGFQVLDTGQEWKCKLHPPMLPSDDIAWQCMECGEWMCKPQLNVPLNTNTALNDALANSDLGISPQLCDDLVVCLSNPRYQVLSWLLDWQDLHRLCVMYLNDPERTKNVVTELKFVDIDYSMFRSIKKEPVDELTGIEPGYEQYLDHDFSSDDQMSTISEDSASQESRPYSLGSDGSGDLPFNKFHLLPFSHYTTLQSSPLPPIQQKSDPNILKSLRMFRPNLKRQRQNNDDNGQSKKAKYDAAPEKLPFPPAANTNGTTSSSYPNFYNQPLTHPRVSSHTNNFETASKNGQVATLPTHPTGGQVAQINHPLRPSKNLVLNPMAMASNGTGQKLTSERTLPTTQSKSVNQQASLDRKNISNSIVSSLVIQLTSQQVPVSSNSYIFPRNLSTSPNPAPAANRCPTTTTSSAIHTTSMASSNKSQSQNEFKSMEKTSPCNSFKGISVQDILDKSIDNCDDNNKDANLFSNLNGKNVEHPPTDAPLAPKLLIKLDKERNFSSAIIDQNLPKNNKPTDVGTQKLSVYIKDCFKPNVSVKTIDLPVAGLLVNSRPGMIKKELKVILCRMNTTRVRRLNLTNGICKTKCDKIFMKKRKSENQPAPKKVQKKLSSSPLQDVNERVPSSDEDRFICDDVDMSKKPIPASMNPRVMLERLPSSREYVRSILANVPGLNDFQMIQPGNVDQIVNVVQISGGRPTSNVTAQNTQTSTQVTPHIQRIGQPRVEKPESTDATAATTISTVTTTTSKPTTSQPSTLINILSQQVRPTPSNCVRSRPSPLINIFSQQIVRPATQKSAETTKVATQATETTTTVKNSAPVTVTKNSTATASQGTILQFICSKSSLPKFQQAFGKTVYNNRTAEAEVATTTTNEGKVEASKTQTKNIPVNVQPIQGGVIYTRQMPVGQTINLIPPGRGQVFRIATSNAEQISLVKDTVIHSKMSALLAAALQGNKQKNESSQCDDVSDSDGATRVTVTRPTLVQNARIVKPVLQIPSNVIRSSPQSNLSSTTLEQLREFDMVYKQIKERSSTSSESSTQPESSEPQQQQPSPQRISVTYVNQGQKFTQLSPVVVVSSYCNLQAAASPALSVTSQGSSSPCVTPAPTPTTPKVASKTKGKSLKTTTASKSSPIPKPQQKPQEDEHTTQRIFDILAEYAEQLRNSPDLNNKPAPRRRSNPPTNPNQNSKRKKSSGSKKSGQCSSMSEADTEDQRTMGSEDSSCGVVQLSVPDEEQPVQSTVATTESNDSNSSSRQLILTDTSGSTQTRNLIIADSSVGEALKMSNTAVLVPGNYIMPVSMVKGGQQIAVVSGGSKILATVPARSGPNMLLFQSFLNQNRKTGVSTVKYSSIQPLSGISSQSIAGVSAQPPVILPPNSHNLTAVTLGQPLTIKKVESSDRNTELLLTISPQEPQREIKEVVTAVVTAAATPVQQPDSTSTSVATSAAPVVENTVVATVAKSEATIVQNTPATTTDKIQFQYQAKPIITAPIATPVIAQATTIKEDNATSSNLITMNISADNLKETKNERVQSVLVTACTSNGPMLSHTPPRYRKPSDTPTEATTESTKEEFLHNGEKPNSEQKHFHSNTVFYTNKSKKAQSSQPAGSQSQPAPRLDRDLHQMQQRKQAALERELRLQKSLSEECEDLGVDEPSTSDLFPEADLLFDANNSPSFDQTSQDLIKRPQDIKETATGKMGLFSDDDNSSSLRTDLFEYVEFQAENELEYQNQQLTNGQNTTESGNSSCEDSTLLQNCASMSDVTLNSPISPDLYSDNPATAINKYKFKYTNKKKEQQAAAAANDEILSSEDTTGSVGELKAIPDPDAEQDQEVEEISCKSDCNDIVESQDFKSSIKGGGGTCEGLHCDDEDSPSSGRGARRSVRKLCSCCNGNEEPPNAIAVTAAPARKRPNSRPHTPAPHKKATFLKKR